MASASEISDGRGGSEFSSTRVFRYFADSSAEDENTIRASGLVPIRGAQHPRNPALFVKDVNARHEARTARQWIVTVEYVTAGGLTQLVKETNINPLVRRVIVEGKTVQVRRSGNRAYLLGTKTIGDWKDGKGASFPQQRTPVCTSAREIIEGRERIESQFAWEVTYNVDRIPFVLADYLETINKTPVQIRGLTLPKWTLLFGMFNHTDIQEQPIVAEIVQVYYGAKFALLYRKDTWVQPVTDRGYFELEEGTGNQIEMLTDDGKKPSAPLLLDGQGHKLAKPTEDKTVYRWYSDYPEVDFTSILAPLRVQG